MAAKSDDARCREMVGHLVSQHQFEADHITLTHEPSIAGIYSAADLVRMRTIAACALHTLDAGVTTLRELYDQGITGAPVPSDDHRELYALSNTISLIDAELAKATA